jgi:hypothetical protein
MTIRSRPDDCTNGADPLCMRCKHLIEDPEFEGYRCEAYPDGIPHWIINTKLEHRIPFPGDRGIQFEPIESQRKPRRHRLDPYAARHPRRIEITADNTTQSIEGPTPNGGDYAIAFFFDERGNPTAKNKAKRVEIVEYNIQGVQIFRNYGLMGRKRKK